MQNIKIDHLTIAGADLALLEAKFHTLGLPTQYGGLHSNGITHMSLLSFEDESYIELISTKIAGQTSPLWHKYICENAGLCAWAIAVEDIEAEVARISSLGVMVEGPIYMHRRTPIGGLAEWDLAFLGNQAPGTKLPFLIKDRTPRSVRVAEGESLVASGLMGIAKIILLVADMTEAITLLGKIFDLTPPLMEEYTEWQAVLADFPATPIMLATPLDSKSWLQTRLNRYGEVICGVLLTSGDMARTAHFFHTPARTLLFDQQVIWLDESLFPNNRIGIIAG